MTTYLGAQCHDPEEVATYVQELEERLAELEALVHRLRRLNHLRDLEE